MTRRRLLGRDPAPRLSDTYPSGGESMSASTLWKHQITLPAVAASVRRARDFTDCHLREHRLPDLVADMRLVTSELATNSVRHAGTPFRIEMQARDGYVLLTVRDGSLAPRVVRFPSTSAEAGRG